MDNNSASNPSEKLFNDHIRTASFLLGLEDGYWDLLDDESNWPHRFMWVKNSFSTDNDRRIYLFFDLENYPGQAPTSMPWDINYNKLLDYNNWPKGNDAITKAFTPNWSKGHDNALYIPCDRKAMAGHEQPWQQQYPNVWWTSDKTIVHYLRTVYNLLN